MLCFSHKPIYINGCNDFELKNLEFDTRIGHNIKYIHKFFKYR